MFNITSICPSPVYPHMLFVPDSLNSGCLSGSAGLPAWDSTWNIVGLPLSRVLAAMRECVRGGRCLCNLVFGLSRRRAGGFTVDVDDIHQLISLVHIQHTFTLYLLFSIYITLLTRIDVFPSVLIFYILLLAFFSSPVFFCHTFYSGMYAQPRRFIAKY